MVRPLRWIACGLAVALALPAAGETVTLIDMRTEVDGDQFEVLFIAHAKPHSRTEGDTFVQFLRTSENGTKFDGAFGLHLVDGKIVLGALDEDHVAGIRADESTKTLRVLANADAYAEAHAHYETFAAKEQFEYSLIVENTDFTQWVSESIGLYPPYRSPWRPVNMLVYYADMTKLNKNRGKQSAADEETEF